MNFCVQNGCPEVHLYDNNELYSQRILLRPIRLGVPYYRKCMRAENRPKNLPYCCELHKTCCTCAGFGHIMKTVRAFLEPAVRSGKKYLRRLVAVSASSPSEIETAIFSSTLSSPRNFLRTRYMRGKNSLIFSTS